MPDSAIPPKCPELPSEWEQRPPVPPLATCRPCRDMSGRGVDMSTPTCSGKAELGHPTPQAYAGDLELCSQKRPTSAAVLARANPPDLDFCRVEESGGLATKNVRWVRFWRAEVGPFWSRVTVLARLAPQTDEHVLLRWSRDLGGKVKQTRALERSLWRWTFTSKRRHGKAWPCLRPAYGRARFARSGHRSL